MKDPSTVFYCFARRATLWTIGILYWAALSTAQAETPTTPSPDLALTPQEIAWLKSHPQVRFTGDPNWLPYEAFNDQGEYIGIVAEHLQLIRDKTGLSFKLSPSRTWTESTEKAKRGEVDVLSETDDSDLKSHLHFTHPYLANPIVIAMRSNENEVKSLAAIRYRRIALIKDYGYAAKIRRKYNTIEFVTVADIQDGLISVSSGKADALLCTLALCSYTIQQLGLTDVRITGTTEFDTKLALGVQKDNPLLLSILNKAIRQITPAQQQQILDNWIPQAYGKQVDYTLTYVITVIAIGLLSLFYYWNRRLSREVKLRKAAEQQLTSYSQANERYRILFYESPVGHALNRLATGDFISVNEAFSQITGYSLKELNQLSYWDLTPESYAEQEQVQLDSLNTTGKYGPYEKYYIQKNGKRIAVRLNGSLITDPNGEKLILSVVEDISAYAEAQEKLQLSSLVLDNSSEAMMITDAQNRIITVNPAFSETTGYTFAEVKGKKPDIFQSGKHDATFYQSMWESIEQTGRWQGEIWDKRKNGELYAKWLTIDTITNDSGQIERYVALFSDITERKKSQEIIWQQANFDDLTGLPNRTQFQHQLQNEISQASNSEERFALLLIDLDTFKEVNDTLGHDKGDLLLQIAAKRIRHSLRDDDFVARLGGDEFTIILRRIENISDINRVCAKVIQALAEPYHLEEEMVHSSASVGITIFPDDATTPESLIKNADQAMYASKNQGRNRYSRFNQALQDAAQKKLRMSNELRRALANQEFEIYFQPIVDLTSNQIAKAEALLRWPHPEHGMIPPLEFIPLAEDIGIITDIGDWVCNEAQRLQKEWSTRYGANIQVSINMSPVQFKAGDRNFGDGWLDGQNGNNLVLEITEGLLLESDQDILARFNQLRDAGVEVAIDDFGTGYSSLSYLKKFHIDYLKIDQSFIRNLDNDPNDLALSEAIIVMAHKLGLKVVAEGVEKGAHHTILTEAGCDYAQGYFYSRPLPIDEFEDLLTAFTLNAIGQ